MPAAVTLEDVSKRYRIYHQRHDSFKESFLRRRRGVYEDFWALRDVSFEIDEGTTVGIIGPNGSGKSTTLKLIAHILHPDGGHLEVNGRVSALLELGTGFHHDYTGRENIFLNGALLGIRRATIRQRLEEIIAFSELANFIDNPVKTYSSGQYMRLAFSIAVNVDPDVLLIDEVLAVGDAAFAQKCFDRISRFRTEEKTIVLVSHDLKAVEKFCDRALWIDQGHIRADGVPSQVTHAYLEAVQVREQEALADAPRLGRDPRRWGTLQAEIARVEVLDGTGRPQYVFDSGEPMQVRITYRCPAPVADPVFGIGIYRSDGVHCYGPARGRLRAIGGHHRPGGPRHLRPLGPAYRAARAPGPPGRQRPGADAVGMGNHPLHPLPCPSPRGGDDRWSMTPPLSFVSLPPGGGSGWG